jgi:beta-glucosidase
LCNWTVMTDWFGGDDSVAQMVAGNNLLMPGTAQQANSIIRAVKAKKLDEAVLDRNIEKILNVLVQMPRFRGYKPSNKPDLRAHALIARTTAADGMVLLKNVGSALPLPSLPSGKKVAAFGNTSYPIITRGTGSGHLQLDCRSRTIQCEDRFVIQRYPANGLFHAGQRYGRKEGVCGTLT